MLDSSAISVLNEPVEPEGFIIMLHQTRGNDHAKPNFRR
jgi:hypothetical protein